ncbi:MAG: carboxymuconolactone decarboxylase family protein [Prevotella sp.]|jgi:4-carboxymuconolactone decarboxylase|uniref:Carboxymuconolactone decarboxylase family protein n=1 Tax=Segatella cerevisiae TaxID=2053716 RepID=A0ABT1BVU3_9BACT|nr:carboxymuconolactone decarboxylase family protein [Segatella cerevisiae]MCI1370983.1 carboxymuconolactone decarboxylase family protein [Prevotella sp.]MCI1474230.1 carboxymuconolactone decarboxylase family protein [Prevotella sp.]MCI1518988.1 carboxymuconolactone decarboxylase family protein [Prevotella sp.]MCI1549739.1 carboxymuconolactone decarboxylase family protein [Prevotella sp.]MCI1596399.1 carboxymuconolactone decarboxylase family protein [Prevotella sp.]
MEKKNVNISMFPIGEKLPEKFSQYFIGQAYLAPLTKSSELNCPISNVTFEPGCRNNWHSHTGGQLLIATGGKGYYQEKGKPAIALFPGDIVEIEPDVIHWHGAAPDSWFSHLAIETNPGNNKPMWLEAVTDEQYKKATAIVNDTAELNLSETAVKNHNKLWPGYESKTAMTDPELIKIFDNWAFDEIIAQSKIDTKIRVMMIIGSCIAQGALTEYKMFVNAALNVGVIPVEVKEILYQSAAYVGMAKVVDFLSATNEIMQERGITLPLEAQSTTTRENRFEKGLAVQKSIFGETINKMLENAPKDQLQIQDYLSDNCFGDYYTRTGLNIKIRELLTYCILISMGGTDMQVRGHIQGNLNVGNDRETLIGITTQLLPYIGYPRTLNAMNAINEVVPIKK